MLERLYRAALERAVHGWTSNPTTDRRRTDLPLTHVMLEPGHTLLAPALAAENAKVRGGVELAACRFHCSRDLWQRCCCQRTRGGVRELAPRVVHGWQGLLSLLVESCHRSAQWLESSQAATRQMILTHASDALAANC